MFLCLMVAGLVGLLCLALPAFHHGKGVPLGHGHIAQPKLLGVGPASAHAHPLVKHGGPGQRADGASLTRFVPSPRMVFSLLALYGAFGHALLRGIHLPPVFAALVAALPAIAAERFLILPVWKLAFRFQGQPSSPLEALILCEATAVTSFRNGRGLVAVTRDGRTVQFAARLVARDQARVVGVGARLLVEEVDARQEKLTISIIESESRNK